MWSCLYPVSGSVYLQAGPLLICLIFHNSFVFHNGKVQTVRVPAGIESLVNIVSLSSMNSSARFVSLLFICCLFLYYLVCDAFISIVLMALNVTVSKPVYYLCSYEMFLPVLTPCKYSLSVNNN